MATKVVKQSLVTTGGKTGGGVRKSKLPPVSKGSNVQNNKQFTMAGALNKTCSGC